MPDQPPNPLAGDTPLIHAVPFSSVNSRRALAALGLLVMGFAIPGVLFGAYGEQGFPIVGTLVAGFGLVAVAASIFATSQTWTVRLGEIAIEVRSPVRVEHVTLTRNMIVSVRAHYVHGEDYAGWRVHILTVEGRRFRGGLFATKADAENLRKAIETRVFGYATNPELPFP